MATLQRPLQKRLLQPRSEDAAHTAGPDAAAAYRRAFDGATDFTVGAEEELMLVGRYCLDLAPAVEDVLADIGDDPRFARELRACQIEVITPPHDDAAGIAAELLDARRVLAAAAAGRFSVLAAGTHPNSNEVGGISDGARYRAIADEYAWVASHSVPCGLHVHVAVPGADRTLAVYNAMRSYLPELSALSANSPYMQGFDTGMATIRPKLNEFFPRSGIPPELASWQSLCDFEAWGRRGGAFPDWTHFWWDMRLSIANATIEVRVADAQTRIADSAAIVAVVQSLALDLAERWDVAGSLPVHDTWRIRENAWSAQRHGTTGHLLDLETGRRTPTRQHLHELLDRLEPAARRLGCSSELEHARTLADCNGAERQRAACREVGIAGMDRWLVDQGERDVAEPCWHLD